MIIKANGDVGERLHKQPCGYPEFLCCCDDEHTPHKIGEQVRLVSAPAEWQHMVGQVGEVKAVVRPLDEDDVYFIQFGRIRAEVDPDQIAKV